jgi:hypothetical protein
MTPTTPSSGAADRAIEDCPELNMGNYDEVEVERLNDWAIRANDEIDRLHALAAGQATAAPAQPAAQQGVAYAALPTSNYAGRVYEEGFLIGTCPLYTADQLRAFADATYALRASHGQAYPTIGNLCARIKAADDAAADRDYMLDSDDCIKVLRGEWKAPLAMDKPDRAARAPADSVQEDAARYRWLRDEAHPDGVVNDDIHVHVDSLHYPNRWALIGPELDAAVDAARKQGVSHDR